MIAVTKAQRQGADGLSMNVPRCPRNTPYWWLDKTNKMKTIFSGEHGTTHETTYSQSLVPSKHSKSHKRIHKGPNVEKSCPQISPNNAPKSTIPPNPPTRTTVNSEEGWIEWTRWNTPCNPTAKWSAVVGRKSAPRKAFRAWAHLHESMNCCWSGSAENIK